MKTVTVQFGSVDNATSFVKAIGDFESHFDLIYGQYVVDAKSLLGVMTLDMRNKIDLRIMERNNEMKNIMEVISPYIAA
ncbi:MAG: HPr family phosphocarrier protein [Lachnospiraceae bacterium]|nr:HPr family phosphocarrier protein [Lachnospiraceae bacterium]MDY5497768.1 HPr family phosphocarrier protein [Anaerobutyricum sp.]